MIQLPPFFFFFGGVQKYYDGPVALIYLFCLWFSNPKVPFFFIFVLFHNINVVNNLPVWKKFVTLKSTYDR